MKKIHNDTPINSQVVNDILKFANLPSIGKASIRQIRKFINIVEEKTETEYIRMEMGIPGLPPSEIGVKAEIEALKNGVASIYPEIYGLPELKIEMSNFAKLFLDIDVDHEGCIPTVGSMQGSFASFLTISKLNKNKDTTLFIDPGFPVNKQQHQILGIPFKTFDVYNFRGNKLREKLESILSKGNITSIIYSNPNNPSWICFTENELSIIGELANKYDVIIIEDLAYFGMDFRKDISKPGVAPYQSSVSKYTDNYILLISSSKSFSYAGQRIGMMFISNELFNKRFPDLERFYKFTDFGSAMVYGTVYALSSGTAHSAQYALKAMLKAINNGEYNFIEPLKEYRDKAIVMKKIFLENGFNFVYDKDEDELLADGFYFTFSYPGFNGEELLERFLYYGISCISLSITGSERTEGLRACVSLIREDQFPELNKRLKAFNEHHKE